MSTPLSGVLAAARSAPRKFKGAGLVVMVVAARSGEGVSTIVRGAAEDAGAPVLIVDLDMKRSTHAAHYKSRGGLGPAVDARIGGASFYRMKDAEGRVIPDRALKRYRAGARRVEMTALAPDALPKGARIQISGDSAYWDALRTQGVLAIVDAPALDRAPLALKLAKHMDAVVLVVSGEPGAAPPAMDASVALAEAGANVIGLIFARASAPVMTIDRLTRQTG